MCSLEGDCWLDLMVGACIIIPVVVLLTSSTATRYWHEGVYLSLPSFKKLNQIQISVFEMGPFSLIWWVSHRNLLFAGVFVQFVLQHIFTSPRLSRETKPPECSVRLQEISHTHTHTRTHTHTHTHTQDAEMCWAPLFLYVTLFSRNISHSRLPAVKWTS